MAHIGKRILKKGDIVKFHPLNETFAVITVDHAAKTLDILISSLSRQGRG